VRQAREGSSSIRLERARPGHDQHAARQGDAGGEASAFVADGVFDHLNQNSVAFADTVADGAGVAKCFSKRAGFAQGEEAGAFQADVHKGGLHAGHHALHAAQDYIADQAVAAAGGVFGSDGAFEGKLLQLSVRHQGDTDFPCPRIDEDFDAHGNNSNSCRGDYITKPAPARSCTVCASGRPTTLE
jgi:hypothetical protein